MEKENNFEGVNNTGSSSPAEEAAKALSQTSGISDENNQTPSENGSNGKKWIVPAGVAAAVVVVGGGFILTHQTDPKDAVIDAFKSITAEGQLDPAEDIFGVQALTELVSSGAVQTGMELNLTKSSDETLNEISGAGLGLDLMSDVDSKQQTMKLSVKYGGADLAVAKLYMNDTQFKAAIPELSNKVFMLDYANDIEGQIKNSPYARKMLEEQGIDIDKFVEYLEKHKNIVSEDNVVLDFEELWNRYKEESKALDNLKAAMTVTKNDKKEYTIDGTTQNCRGYHVVLPKDELINFVKVTKEFVLNDDKLKQDFLSYFEIAAGANGIYNITASTEELPPEEQQEKLWVQTEEMFDNIEKAMETSGGDVALDVYVRKDGKMAGFSYETEALIEEKTIRFYGDVTFSGGYNMLANVEGTLNIENAEGKKMTFSLDKTGTYEAGKDWNSKIIASVEDEEETYQFILDGDYQIANGGYEIKIDLKSNDVSQLAFAAEGTIDELVKGERVNVNVESLSLDTLVADEGNMNVEFTGAFYLKPLEEEITQPDGEAFDILASTEEDYANVASEITGNLFAILMKLMV